MRVVVLAAAVGLVAASSPVLAAPQDAPAGRALAERLAPRPAGALSSPLLSGPALEPGVLLVTTTGRAATDGRTAASAAATPAATATAAAAAADLRRLGLSPGVGWGGPLVLLR